MKNVLIVTDGNKSVHQIAEQIAHEAAEHRVVIRSAGDFVGTDILAAEVCFLGCGEPDPASFTYFAELLQHINLAGRPCGIFTDSSKKALGYLAAMVCSSELALNSCHFLPGSTGELNAWVREVLAWSY